MTLVKSDKTGQYSAVIQTDHGKRSIKTGSTDRREAAAFAKAAKVEDLESAAKIHRLTRQTVQQIVSGKKVTVTQALNEWVVWRETYGMSGRTVDNGVIMLRAWIRDQRLADKMPSEITERMVDDWVNAPGEAVAGSRKGRLASVRSFFQCCCAKVYCQGDPSRLVRVKMNLLTHKQKEAKIVAAFNVDEIDKLSAQSAEQERLAAEAKAKAEAEVKAAEKARRKAEQEHFAAEARAKAVAQAKAEAEAKAAEEARRKAGFWRVAIAIARWTGLRLGDICHLEWDCLADDGRMVVWTDKRDRRVSLPLTLAEFEKDMNARKIPVTKSMTKHFTQLEAEFYPTIRSLIPAHKVHIFPEQCAIAADPRRRAGLSVQFGRLVAAAGIEGKSFHSLRHTYIQQMDALGIPIDHIARSVGHSYTATTRGYMQ